MRKDPLDDGQEEKKRFDVEKNTTFSMNREEA